MPKTQKDKEIKKPSMAELVDAVNTTLADWALGEYINPDDLVGKKGLEVYKEMRRDEQIKFCQQAKIMARLCTSYEIKAGDPDNKDSVEMAEFIENQLDGIEGTFKNKLKDIMTARDYGYSITEKVYEVIETGRWKGKIGIKGLKTKEPFGFKFKVDRFRNLEGIMLDTYVPRANNDNGSFDKPFPPDKFVIYCANKEFNNWYGTSDLRSAYRSYWSKNFIIKFYNIFLERFGMPTLKATYPQEVRNDKALLAVIDQVLKNYQSKAGFRVPEGVTLELLEATRRGDGGYKDAIELHDKKIARALLWPDMAGQEGEAGGSYALARKRFSLFILILEEMGYEIEDSIMFDQIIRPLIRLNWVDVDEKLMPRFIFEPLEEEDTRSRSEVIKMMIETGVVNPKEDWIRDFVNIPDMPDDMKKEIEEERKRQEDEARKRQEEETKQDNPEANPENIEPYRLEYQLRREPFEIEKKVNFEKLVKEVNSYEGYMKADLIEVVRRWRKEVLKQAERLFESKSYTDVNSMYLRNVNEFKTILRNWLIKIHLDSKFREMEVLERSGMDIEIIKKPIPRKIGFSISRYQLPEFDPWEAMPMRESLDFFNAKRLAKITNRDGAKKLITLGKPSELTYYDRSAFAITNIENEYILNKAKMIVMNGIKTGSQREAIRALENLFDKYIELGELKDGKLVTPARLENIVRTNTNDALNKGRMDLYNDSDIDEFVPWVEWSSILDDRTCFLRDTKVKTGSGIKNIQDIELNDKVLTHTGEYKKVYGLHKRIYKGKFVKIKTSNKEVICSADHLIYDGQTFVPAQSLKPGRQIACIKI